MLLTASLVGPIACYLNALQAAHSVRAAAQVTFAEQLGAAKHDAAKPGEGEVSSKNEAKKLAFYLFWNIKPYFDRSYILPEDLEHFLPAKKAAQASLLAGSLMFRLCTDAAPRCADSWSRVQGEDS